LASKTPVIRPYPKSVKKYISYLNEGIQRFKLPQFKVTINIKVKLVAACCEVCFLNEIGVTTIRICQSENAVKKKTLLFVI